jgi:glycosyltransferase involved in cell wall biosynthesis
LTDGRQDLAGGEEGSRRMPALSVVVPAYEEEDSVGVLYGQIVAAVGPLGKAFEIIFVDDGSKDATFARCVALAERDPRVKVVKFRRNCGQTAAMVAGIEEAAGAVIVTMDADLQNDPADIPRLLAKIDAGYDLVVGWRRNRKEKGLRVPLSKVANRLIARITGVDIKDNGCSLKAYRAAVIKQVPLYAEMHRFIPAMSSLAGARIAQIPVNHRAREHGHSKYGFSRIYKVLVDMIVIKTLLLFAARPVYCFIGSAAAFGLLALVCALVAIWLGVASTASSVVVFTSVAIMLGALALFLVLIGLLASLIYLGASDSWNLQALGGGGPAQRVVRA